MSLADDISGLIEKQLTLKQKRQLKSEELRAHDIFCHACDNDIRFVIDMNLDGNHVLNCPNCDHEHCRVVRDGEITGERWGSRNGPTYSVTTCNVYIVTGSTFTDYSTANTDNYALWTGT